MQESAKILIELTEEKARLDREQMDLDNKKNSVKSQIEAVEKKLLERVGGKIRLRHFAVNDKVVRVEFEQGVSVHQLGE